MLEDNRVGKNAVRPLCTVDIQAVYLVSNIPTQDNSSILATAFSLHLQNLARATVNIIIIIMRNCAKGQ